MAVFLAIVFLASAAHAAIPKIRSAGTLDVSQVAEDQWTSLAMQEIQATGPVLAVPGGVTHTVPENQRSGEDCWSYALSLKIQTFLSTKHLPGGLIKLSPEYVEFWHIYDQILVHLDDFSAVA